MDENRCLPTTLGASALGLLTSPAWAQAGPGPRGDYGWHMWNGWGGWMMGMPMILFVILLVIVIALVVRAMRRGRGGHTDALEILRSRYARGEIDRAEYEEKRGALEP